MIQFKNLYHRSFPSVPIRHGLPVPEGKARSTDQIALTREDGSAVSAAVTPMATWPDGSIRWALLDVIQDFAPSEEGRWRVNFSAISKAAEVKNPVVVRKGDDGRIVVSNGRLEARFSCADGFKMFDRLWADGVKVIDSARGECDIVAINPAGKIFRASYDPSPEVSIEEANPVHAVVRWDGALFAGDGEQMTHYRLKLHFFADNPYVKIEHSAICREMPERGVMIREYRIEMETLLDRRKSGRIVRQKNHGVDYFSRLVKLKQNVRLKVPTAGETASLGPTYSEVPGVLGAIGKVLLEDESAFQENVGEFPHFLKPGAPRVAVGGGYALVYPFVGVRDDVRTIVASMLRMGPQHPKGMCVDENRIAFEIYPPTAKLWRLSRGMTKTHHVAISFFGKPLSDDEIDNEAARREFFAETVLRDPIEITLDPAYVRSTKQCEADRLLPFLPEKYPKLETKLAGVKLNGDPLAYSGMMDFGEAISTNNEEDQGHQYVMEYVRSGSYTHFVKFVNQMLHNSTVDVVDWDPDDLRRGGTPYHTDYHQDAVCVPSHTWTEGMFEYAYFTGDREAHRAAIGICDWILRYIKGKPQIVKVDGRETGWPMMALVAGYKATWDKKYLDGAYELVSFYREKVEKFGELLNEEPPGTGYVRQLYGEYAGFEAMHKLWEVTRDEELKQFALACINRAADKVLFNPSTFHSHGRHMDMYMLYAAYDMSRDEKWLTFAKRFLPIVLARPDWDGYTYRRIIHYLNWCHEQGWIDDNLVTLKA